MNLSVGSNLRNSQVVHFRELKRTLMQPKVWLARIILRTLPKAYST
jgi:hypothetical protein